MPSFKAEVSHQLGQAAATERLKGFADKIRERYKDQVSNMQESWGDNSLEFSFKTLGLSIKGKINIEDTVVKLNGTLPFAALPFRGKIENSIKDELAKALS